MSELPGQPWPAMAGRVSDSQRQRLRGELGRIVAGLHGITGSGFGYPAGPLTASWRTAFGGMLDTILAEADQYQVTLPLPAGVIRRRAARHAGRGGTPGIRRFPARVAPAPRGPVLAAELDQLRT